MRTLILAWIAILLLGGSSVLAAQIQQAIITVEGMSCPFCAFGVEKKLRAIPGVARVEVTLKQGAATLTAKEGASIAVAEIPAAVRKAGFTAGAIEIVVVGTVGEKVGPAWSFRVSGSDQGLVLVNVERKLEERVARLAGSERKVRVGGRVHFHADHPPGVEPRTVEEVR